jgi:hypothetical protein
MGRTCKTNAEIKIVVEDDLQVPVSAVPGATSSDGKKKKFEDTSGKALAPKSVTIVKKISMLF